jgi:hypothetical protein
LRIRRQVADRQQRSHYNEGQDIGDLQSHGPVHRLITAVI